MPNNIRRFLLRHLRKMRFLPSKLYVKIHYEYFSGDQLDLANPQDFNAKIEWYKVYFRPKILTTLADKYEVRSFVEEKIGAKYLNELYAVYDSPEKIDFDKLPNSFIIKANHTNGHNIIVKNKKDLDKKKVIKKFKKWLGKNQYYRRGQEWAYKDIKPKIVIEKFLKEDDTDTLADYKFYCFNGEPKFIDVHLDREEDHKSGCYDLEFNLLPFVKSKKFNSSPSDLQKPINFEEMVKVAKLLAKKLPFVRVDLYSVNGKTIFGELTFYPGDARNKFYPEEYNKVIGDYFKLPKLNREKSVINSLEKIEY
ncbi:ATP-grasp fold amidoligase family protein [Winogradskyella vincentii]|uniref:Glycosyltransferase n=1 Tax=Winogradskyella vincentii TaxID=2877122 RepID=A0ABS7Y0T3_9FLAO|nr:ATP-grasp fold amidoligase family protein [Winogradskyella vincentii]MCA0153529.1 glycosyltransferase [Winogradskyella vincentii]